MSRTDEGGSQSERRLSVRDVFSSIADMPEAEHPIPVGRGLAEGVGYPVELLRSVPSTASSAFAGVAYLWGFAEVAETDVVLDLGCGAGLDSLIAARTAGRLIGVDFSPQMLSRARAAAEKAGAANLSFRQGDAESIPLADGEADKVLINGIFNLNPSTCARAGRPTPIETLNRPGNLGGSGATTDSAAAARLDQACAMACPGPPVRASSEASAKLVSNPVIDG